MGEVGGTYSGDTWPCPQVAAARRAPALSQNTPPSSRSFQFYAVLTPTTVDFLRQFFTFLTDLRSFSLFPLITTGWRVTGREKDGERAFGISGE